MKLIHLFVFIFIFAASCFAQNESFLNFQDQYSIKAATNSYFNLGSNFTENIEVHVWGSIEKRGTYRIPAATGLVELISLSGGLTQDAEVEALRIVRKDTLNPGKSKIILINYDDLFNEDNLTNPDNINFSLQNDDILVVPTSASWWTDLRFITTVISLVSAITSLVVVIYRSN